MKRVTSPRASARSNGITIVELMVVVALVAVLVAIAVPNLSDLFINNRLSAAANELVVALNTARSEAMRRGEVVTMRRCDAGGSGAGCAKPYPTNDEDWGRGWYMFVDANRDRALGSGEEIIRFGGAVPSPMTLYRNMYTAGSSLTAAKSSVAFCPDGRVLIGNCATPSAIGEGSMVFVLCYDGKLSLGNRSRSRAVLVNREGRVRLAALNDSGVPLNESQKVVGSSDSGGCFSPKYLN